MRPQKLDEVENMLSENACVKTVGRVGPRLRKIWSVLDATHGTGQLFVNARRAQIFPTITVQHT